MSGGQMADRLGTWTISQKVVGLFPSRANDAVSLGKALHPTCLGKNVPVLCYTMFVLCAQMFFILGK